MGNFLSTWFQWFGAWFQSGFGSGADSEGTNSGDLQTTESTDLPTRGTPLNDCLYQLYEPPIGTPTEVDIIFFHGLQIGDYRNAYWDTWSSDKGKTAWPRTLLGEQALPVGRIMSVSYDSSIRLDAKSGRGDLFKIAENLVQDIILCDRALVGRNQRPVILVGHSLGGIVIKRFILMAIHKMNPEIENDQMKIAKLRAFIGSVRGVFYYATPHHGSPWADLVIQFPGNSKVLIFLKTLSEETERLNEDFRKWRARRQTKASTIAETYPTAIRYGLNAIIVPEASVRCDNDGLYSADADHLNVCKPTDMNKASFRLLKEFIVDNVPTLTRALTSAQNRQEEDENIT